MQKDIAKFRYDFMGSGYMLTEETNMCLERDCCVVLNNVAETSVVDCMSPFLPDELRHPHKLSVEKALSKAPDCLPLRESMVACGRYRFCNLRIRQGLSYSFLLAFALAAFTTSSVRGGEEAYSECDGDAQLVVRTGNHTNGLSSRAVPLPANGAETIANISTFSPCWLTLQSSGKLFVVNCGEGSELQVIDTATDLVLKKIIVYEKDSQSIRAGAVSPDGARAYTTMFGRYSAWVIDLQSQEVICKIPAATCQQREGIAVNPSGTETFVSNSFKTSSSESNVEQNTITIIDNTTNKLAGIITDLNSPVNILFNRKGNKAYVLCWGDNSVALVDAVGRRVEKKIQVGLTPSGLALNERRHRLYVANCNSNSLTVVDAEKLSVIATIAVGNTPSCVAVNREGTIVYVTNSGSNTMSVIDAYNNKVVETIPLGERPQGIALSPSGKTAYIAEQSANNIRVLKLHPEKFLAAKR